MPQTDWPPFVISLIERFLAESGGDIDGAVKLMCHHLLGRHDDTLSAAVRKAVVEIAKARRLCRR